MDLIIGQPPRARPPSSTRREVQAPVSSAPARNPRRRGSPPATSVPRPAPPATWWWTATRTPSWQDVIEASREVPGAGRFLGDMVRSVQAADARRSKSVVPQPPAAGIKPGEDRRRRRTGALVAAADAARAADPVDPDRRRLLAGPDRRICSRARCRKSEIKRFVEALPQGGRWQHAVLPTRWAKPVPRWRPARPRRRRRCSAQPWSRNRKVPRPGAVSPGHCSRWATRNRRSRHSSRCRRRSRGHAEITGARSAIALAAEGRRAADGLDGGAQACGGR